MALAGSLIALLGADVSSFRSDLRSAERHLSSSSARMNRTLAGFDRGITSVNRNVAAWARGMVAANLSLGALVGASGLGLAIKRSVDFADNIGKTADKVGLSTDALQEYRFAADLAGVNTRTLDLALQRFSRRVGEAAQGQGELRATLAQYNIAVRDSAGNTRRLEDVLDDYAEAIRNAESDQEALRLAFKAFDSEGAAAVNIFRDGAEGVRAMRAEARRLGIVIDESLIRQAENAKDELSKLGTVITSLSNVALLKFAADIADIAEGLSDLAVEAAKLRGFIPFTRNEQLARDAIALEALNAEMAELVRNRDNLLAQAERVAGGGQVQRNLAANLDRQIQTIQARIDDINRRFLPPPTDPAPPRTGAPRVAESFVPDLKPLIEAERARNRVLQEGAEADRQRHEDAKARARDLDELIQSQTQSALTRAEVVARSVETPIEAYRREVAELQTLRAELAAVGESGALSTQDFTRAVEAARERMVDAELALLSGQETVAQLDLLVESGAISWEAYAVAMQGARARAEELTEVQQVLADEVAFTMNQAIRGQIDSWQDLGRAAISILQEMIIAMLDTQSVAENMARGLSSIFSGGIEGLGGLLSGLLGGGAGGGIADLPLVPLQHGGPALAGRAHIVGERGKELFVPDVNGFVLPNSIFDDIGGGGNTVNIDARGADVGVETRLRELFAREEPRIIAKAVAASQEARKRNPQHFG